MEDYFMPNIELEEVVCEKDNLTDYTWLFNNIPWMNHDNKRAIVKFDKTIKMYYIQMDVRDAESTEIKSCEFDNVIISAFHSFAGNSFTFEFRLGDKRVHSTHDYESFDYMKKTLKKRYIESIQYKIKGFKNRIEHNENVIKKIKKA